MELGAFSVSLAVKDIDASKRFYENLVLEVDPGSYWMRWYDPATGEFAEGERAEGTRVDIDHAGPVRFPVPANDGSLIFHLRKL